MTRIARGNADAIKIPKYISMSCASFLEQIYSSLTYIL
jgi:hypothetical protein